jgi:hypothetical protein
MRLLDEPVTNWLHKAEVVREPGRGTVVFSVKLGAEDTRWVAEEADRRGLNP